MVLLGLIHKKVDGLVLLVVFSPIFMDVFNVFKSLVKREEVKPMPFVV